MPLCGAPCQRSRCERHGGNRRALATDAATATSVRSAELHSCQPRSIATCCPLCGLMMTANQQLNLDHSMSSAWRCRRSHHTCAMQPRQRIRQLQGFEPGSHGKPPSPKAADPAPRLQVAQLPGLRCASDPLGGGCGANPEHDDPLVELLPDHFRSKAGTSPIAESPSTTSRFPRPPASPPMTSRGETLAVGHRPDHDVQVRRIDDHDRATPRG